MKRFLWLILALTLLTGCTGAVEDTTPSTEPNQPNEPGIYTPGHTLETQSGGAVRVFPLSGSNDGFAFMLLLPVTVLYHHLLMMIKHSYRQK